MHYPSHFSPLPALDHWTTLQSAARAEEQNLYECILHYYTAMHNLLIHFIFTSPSHETLVQSQAELQTCPPACHGSRREYSQSEKYFQTLKIFCGAYNCLKCSFTNKELSETIKTPAVFYFLSIVITVQKTVSC